MSTDPNFRQRALAIVQAAEHMTASSAPPDAGDDTLTIFDAEALAAEIVAHAREGATTGPPSYLVDGPRLVQFLRALASGNYRETAADLARIHPRTVALWCSRGEEEPESTYGVVYRIIRHAEAVAEAEARHRISEAGKMPHLWTANAWGLERKYPDRWAKRPDHNESGLTVMVGGGGQVNIGVVQREP